MNKHECIRLIALKGAVKPDYESNVRYAMRWYSKTFHTPLHIVYSLPLDDIWLAFYEERYQDLSQEELQEEVRLALESPEAQREREMSMYRSEAEEVEFMKMAEKSNANLNKTLEKVTQAVKTLESMAPVSLPEAPVIEEGIEMTFLDESELEKMLNGGMALETKEPSDTKEKVPVDPLSFK